MQQPDPQALVRELLGTGTASNAPTPQVTPAHCLPRALAAHLAAQARLEAEALRRATTPTTLALVADTDEALPQAKD